MICMIPTVNLGVGEMGFMFVIYTFLKNKSALEDINSTNLPCLNSVLPGDTSNILFYQKAFWLLEHCFVLKDYFCLNILISFI